MSEEEEHDKEGGRHNCLDEEFCGKARQLIGTGATGESVMLVVLVWRRGLQEAAGLLVIVELISFRVWWFDDFL